MTGANSRQLIYPAQRAVEHATTVPGLQPLRLFALLWPLRRVETTAQVYDEQAYELIERFIALVILDGSLSHVPDLARFLGVPESLVQRCLNLLSVIGHVQLDGPAAQLTELGARSARDQIRYVAKESRQDLLFEAFTRTPLPRRYYEPTVPVLPDHNVDDNRLADRTRFIPLFSPVAFFPEAVQRLAEQPDRIAYNLPKQLHDLRTVGIWDAFLPVYLIETTDNLLAYSAARTPQDQFIEAACRRTPQIHEMIRNETWGDPQQIWTDWLATANYGPGILSRRHNGLWRATFRADAFGPEGPLRLNQIGSFRFRSKHFVQLWCDDERLRRATLLDRSLRVLQRPDAATEADLFAYTTRLSDLLEVPTPDRAELRRYAEREGAYESLTRLDALG